MAIGHDVNAVLSFGHNEFLTVIASAAIAQHPVRKQSPIPSVTIKA
jgi:hypothetical protein